MSNLFVDKISGKSGTSSGAPITLSGDTATLGSGVTIPAAGVTGTLGSGVTFPAGHVIQVKSDTYTGATFSFSVTATRAYGTNLEVEIDCASTSNYLLLQATMTGQYNWGQAATSMNAGFRYTTDNWSSEARVGPKDYVISHHGHHATAQHWLGNPTMHLYTAVPTTSAMTIQIMMRCPNTGGTSLHINQTATGREVSTLTVMEIQG